MFRVPSNGSSSSSSNSNQKYEGPDGMTATIITNEDGDKVIKVTDDNNNVVEYVGEQANESVDDMTNSPMNEQHASFNNEDSDERGGNNKTWNNKTNKSSDKYDDKYDDNKYSNSVSNSVSNSDNSYDAYLPPGIPKSEISPGDEDLYILKSQVVPPVCPACPAYGPTAMLAKTNSASNSETTDSTTTDPNEEEEEGSSGKYPPCPACDRCPEPSYACKMVPNYSNFNSSTMPVPVLSAFSTFGM